MSSFPWQNADDVLDVNRDGFVVPLDVLLIINEINANGAHILTGNPDPLEGPYYDTSGDNFVAPVDVLLVINHLNEPAGAEGESQNQPDGVASNWPDAYGFGTDALWLTPRKETPWDVVTWWNEDTSDDDWLDSLVLDVLSTRIRRQAARAGR